MRFSKGALNLLCLILYIRQYAQFYLQKVKFLSEIHQSIPLQKSFFFQNSILAKHVTVSTFLASKFFIHTMYVADASGSESYNQFVVDLKQQIDMS